MDIRTLTKVESSQLYWTWKEEEKVSFEGDYPKEMRITNEKKSCEEKTLRKKSKEEVRRKLTTTRSPVNLGKGVEK